MGIDQYEGEDVIITFERNGSNEVINVTGKITNIKPGGGEVNTEVKYSFGNKQRLFSKPREKFKLDLDVILDNSAVFEQAFLGGSVRQAGTMLKSSSTQDYWRIILWFIPYDEQKNNHTMPPLTSPNARVMIFVDAKAPSFEKSFDVEDVLVGTISFEMSATDPDGYANYFDYYTNSTTSTLIQLTTTYSAEMRGTLTWTTAAFSGAYST